MAIPSGNLSLELLFEKYAGLVAYDTSGNGKNGTLTGCAFSDGKLGNSVSLTDTVYSTLPGPDPTQYITLSSTIALSGDFSISFWIYPNASTWNGICCPYGTQNYILVRSGQNVQVGINYTNYQTTSGIGTISGTWTHVVVLRTGTTLRVYKNGTQLGNNVTVSSAAFSIYCVGASRYATTYRSGCNAKLDMFRVYSRALSADEITDLYEEPTTEEPFVWGDDTYSQATGDSGGYVEIDPEEAYSVSAGSDPYNPITVLDCCSESYGDLVLCDGVVIAPRECASRSTGDEVAIGIEWAYPHGDASCRNNFQAIDAEAGGVAGLTQQYQTIDAEGSVHSGGPGDLSCNKQIISGTGGAIGTLKASKQAVSGEGHLYPVSVGLMKMYRQRASGSAFLFGSWSDGLIRNREQLVSATGWNLFASVEMHGLRQRMNGECGAGNGGDVEIANLELLIEIEGGLQIEGGMDLVMDEQDMFAVASTTNRFSNVILQYQG